LLDYKFYCLIILVNIIKYFTPFIFDFKNFILYVKNYIGKEIIFIKIVNFKIIFIIFEIKLIDILDILFRVLFIEWKMNLINKFFCE